MAEILGNLDGDTVGRNLDHVADNAGDATGTHRLVADGDPLAFLNLCVVDMNLGF
jgi:hypothetical protein